ncbi:MAG: HD domain-containing protein [Armatimonadetes bacterium]|nr:HD domain-containing protein [Armatimonadota bacterium]
MAIENRTTGRPVTLKDVKSNPKVRHLIDGANELMKAMGYTEHGHRHVEVVGGITRSILEKLEAEPRYVELAKIAAHLHDIGNVINRIGHPVSGAGIAYRLLDEMGMGAAEIAPVLGAIGNHEELAGSPISLMGAALIIADKSDVHRSRVQNPILESFDIHDRVNYAVTRSRVDMVAEDKTVSLKLEIDTSFATVMEYFEIFLQRMVMCRNAAQYFGYRFTLEANGAHLE